MVTLDQGTIRRGRRAPASYGEQENTLYDQQEQEVQDSSSYTIDMPEETYQDAVDTPQYVGETEYQTEQPTTENDEEYTIVKTFMPNVEREYVAPPIIEQKRNVVTKTKIRLNARGKILVCVYALVATLLVAFAIYNAVALGNISTAIAEKQAQYQTLTQEVNTLNTEFVNTNNVNNVPDGYSMVNELNYQHIAIEQRPVLVSVEAESNWFDKVCEFLSNLF